MTLSGHTQPLTQRRRKSLFWIHHRHSDRNSSSLITNLSRRGRLGWIRRRQHTTGGGQKTFRYSGAFESPHVHFPSRSWS